MLINIKIEVMHWLHWTIFINSLSSFYGFWTAASAMNVPKSFMENNAIIHIIA